MKIAIYSRKSKYTGKGDSIGNQVQMCKDYIACHFPNEEHEFFEYEDEGFTGAVIDRPQFKKLMKGADYMSAISEIWRQLKAGTIDNWFFDALRGHVKKFENGGVAELTPNTKGLLEYLVGFANRVEIV